MKITKFIALVAFAAITTTASAQFANTSNSTSGGSGFGIENDCSSYSRINFGYIGINFKAEYDDVSVTDDSDNLKGFTVGYTKGINLTSACPLFLEAGGQLNYARWSESDSDDGLKVSEAINFLSLSVPLNLTYKLSFSNGFYVAPYAGINFELGLLLNNTAKASYHGQSESKTQNMYSSDDMGDDSTFNRFQMGYQVGGNIGYKRFNLGLGYKGSFLPIFDHDGLSIQTGGPVITVGYNF